MDSVIILVSIRSPHRSKGRPGGAQVQLSQWKVSIRSPHRSKGRLAIPAMMRKGRLLGRLVLAQFEFQSAPLTEARGDTRPVAGTIDPRASGFNPLPSPKPDYELVSIRSPHRSKGRHTDGAMDSVIILVSIRSPHRSKGRPAHQKRFAASKSAYSVSIRSPHRSKGRLRKNSVMPRLVSVSIRSPHRSKGRLIVKLLTLVGYVSIRSPHRSKGRRKRRRDAAGVAMFQSAPLTEARGDAIRSPARPVVTAQTGVSIRSPHRSKGRRKRHRCCRRCHVSIRSPHRSKGSPGCSARGSCFNPLPSPKQGETLVAITSGITKTYTGKCAIRSDSCQECPTRLPRNAITCCYAGSFQLRESKCKTPSLHFRARYKTSGSFKSTGSPTP